MASILEVFGGGGGVSLVVLNAYNSSEADLDTVVAIPVPLDTLRNPPAGFALAGGLIEVTSPDKAKTYAVSAQVSGNIQTTLGQSTWEIALAVNGVELDGTRSDASSASLTVSAVTMATSAVVELGVGDQFAVTIRRISGGDEFTLAGFGAHLVMIGVQ